MERIRPTQQVYAKYTPEDFQVWQTLFDRQMELLAGKVAPEYLEALQQVGFRRDRIPHMEVLNARLAGLTGWKIVTVPNIVEADRFFQHLAKKEFTATCWLRRLAELDYLEEPDMFHDVFAHVPLLANEAYSHFFQQMGELALRYIHDPDIVLQLQRLYWFTIEFGLIQKSGGPLQIYGAGIISSKGETEYALSDASEKRPFEVGAVMQQAFRTDQIQPVYFVIESFEQLADCLPQVEAALVPSRVA